ncbi:MULTISPECIES: hypothetical protein [unclassified Bradyrhizobium]|uniref:hypothetical protein n=1 Tax=unclassified Bradyrhizobium TaxID=2631580 RepID=UPI00339B0434
MPFVLDDTLCRVEITELMFDAIERPISRRIMATQGQPASVSTIFLHITGQFESMVFGGEHGGREYRAHNYEAALINHERLCRLVGLSWISPVQAPATQAPELPTVSLRNRRVIRLKKR